jgi:hypothetical protein
MCSRGSNCFLGQAMKAAGSEKAPEFEESEEAYERGEADRTETQKL